MNTGLEAYRNKRDFSRTSEPPGHVRKNPGKSFVVQKHSASRLHYDFRIEHGGVLKSWSLPKGPSDDPHDKRLAVETEDHPVEYGAFEGIIPRGEYGGGTVLIWDRGTWEPVGDPNAGLRAGKLELELHGSRLTGLYTLVRMKARKERARPNWLFLKKRDGHERSSAPLLTERYTTSVASGRTIDEIAAGADDEAKRARSTGALAAPTWSDARKSKKKPRISRDGPRVPVSGVGISHGERVVDPSSHTTKLELARYYEHIAPLFLMHAAKRPLALVRCPDGAAGQCFFQKHRHVGMSEEIHADQDREGEELLTVTHVAGVVELVQWGVVELHGWGSRLDRLESPDWIVLDLDPAPEVDWTTLVEGAYIVRERLFELGLSPFVKTTGGKGLHIVVPLVRRQEWEFVRKFAKVLAVDLANREPMRFTQNMSKRERRGRIFVDHLRNVRGSTAVLPYSARAREGLPVAMPIEWSELDAVEPRMFTVSNVSSWLVKRRRDPWSELRSAARVITRKMLDALGA